MFDSDLATLVSNGDEANLLHRALLRSLQDLGGNCGDLNRLLKDPERSKTLLQKIAREVIGGPWKLVDEVIDIGAIDFRCPQAEFVTRYPGVCVWPAAIANTYQKWTEETLGIKPWKYQLVHSDQPLLFHKIIKWIPRGRAAGFRELVAYMAHIAKHYGSTLENTSDREIIAPGSQDTDSEGTIYTNFPKANWNKPPEINWHGAKRPNTDRFGTNCFYLIRVY